MQILAALFIDGIELRQVPGPSTRIDLTGVHFSMAAPSPPSRKRRRNSPNMSYVLPALRDQVPLEIGRQGRSPPRAGE